MMILTPMKKPPNRITEKRLDHVTRKNADKHGTTAVEQAVNGNRAGTAIRIGVALTLLVGVAGGAMILTNGSGKESSNRDLFPIDLAPKPRGLSLSQVLAAVEAVPPHAFTPKEYADVMKLINDLKIGTATWNHPEGASDAEPKNPLVVIAFPHPMPDASFQHQEHIDRLHALYVILATLHKRGLPTVRSEGVAIGTTIPPTVLKNPDNTPVLPAMLNGKLDRTPGLASLIDQGADFTHIAATGLPGLTVEGAEDPAMHDQMTKDQPAHEENAKRVGAAMKAMRDTPGGRFTYRYNPDTSVFTLNEQYPFDAKELEKDLSQWIANQDAHATGSKNADLRNKTVAGLPTGVVFFGTGHMEEIRRLSVENKRSVALVWPQGTMPVPHGAKDGRRQNVENLLATVRHCLTAGN